MVFDLHNLRFTPKAALFMCEHYLVMRNSYSKQVESLHYQSNNFGETHSAGTGTYCVPLWTILRPKLLQAIAKQKEKIGTIFADDYPPEDPSQSEVDSIMEDFVEKIRNSISHYTAFGTMFRYFYDYELLISSRGCSLDDIGRYPTGGRCRVEFDPKTIIFRASFSKNEVEFFKTILNKNYDPIIDCHQLMQGKEEVCIQTFRLGLCNQLATEIIVSKLMLFLNAPKHLQTDIVFSNFELEILLKKVVKKYGEDNLLALRDNRVSYVQELYPRYQSEQRYMTPIFPLAPLPNREEKSSLQRVPFVTPPNLTKGSSYCEFFTKNAVAVTVGVAATTAIAAMFFL